MYLRPIFSALTVLLCLSSLLLAGCDSRPKRVPVSGTVYIDGQPLKGGHIRVIPSSARSAQAMIDSEGRFTLYTFDPGDGVVPGEHPVEIAAAEDVPGGKRWLIPKKYASYSTSGVTIKIDKPTKDLRIDLTWEGETPVVEAVDTSGDAPPVGVLPTEGADPPAP